MKAAATAKKLLALALALMMLSGCGYVEKAWDSVKNILPLPSPAENALTEPAAPETPTPLPVTPPPVAGKSGVYTDWSKLTEYRPGGEIFTRLREERITELIPSKDYGRLLPFMGEHLYEAQYGYQVGGKYGLVTLDGCIVLDAVCTNIWEASNYYSSVVADTAEYLVLEKTVKNPNQTNEWDAYLNIHAIAAADGSWVTPFEYGEVFVTGAGVVGVTDWATNTARIFDENGEVIFEMSSQPFFEELDAGACNGLYQLSEGWAPLRFRDGSTRFVSLDGEILSGGESDGRFQDAYGFRGGLAVVRTGGYMGVINKSCELVVEPQYDNIQSSTDGRMIAVKYKDGGKDQTCYVLDRQGKILYEVDGELSYHELAGCYVNYDFGSGKYTAYDRDMNVITVHGIPADSFVYDGGVAVAYSAQGIWALADGREVLLPGAQYISWYADGFFCCADSDGDMYIADADGRVVYEIKAPEVNNGMSLWYTRDSATGELYFVLYDYGMYGASRHRVLDKTGKTIVTGYEWGEPVNGLFMCFDGMFSGYKNTKNEWVFRVRVSGDA